MRLLGLSALECSCSGTRCCLQVFSAGSFRTSLTLYWGDRLESWCHNLNNEWTEFCGNTEKSQEFVFARVNENDEDFELERKKEEQISPDIYYLKRSEITNCKNNFVTERQARQSPWDSEGMCPVKWM